MLLGSIAASPYSSPNGPSKHTTDLQLNAMASYYCDSSINYDLLPSIRNRVMFFAGMQVRRFQGLWLGLRVQGLGFSTWVLGMA